MWINILNRLSTVLATNALPDEAALRGYVRKILNGMIFLVIGSVLFGAVIAASLYLLYDQMLIYGYARSAAATVALAIAFILIIICFTLSNSIFSGKCRKSKKSVISKKMDFFRDITSEVANGFIEGLFEGSKKPSASRKRK